jgi:uncharacterized membrane protein
MMRTAGWWVMTSLALLVAAYAFALVALPSFRPELVQVHFQQRPLLVLAHFLGGGIAMAIGAFQLHAGLRSRFLSSHRWLGRIYIAAVLAGGTAGLVLAINSTAGPAAQWGFGLLAVAWLASTFNAYRHIRDRNFVQHRAWMIRSYALTLAAVTLRIYLPASMIAALPMDTAYSAIAWLCWVPNLLVAEWFVRSRSISSTPSR